MNSDKPPICSRMDMRRAPRFFAGQTVAVTVYAEPLSTYAAEVRNASGHGLGLFLPSPVKSGTALRVSLEDSILLGEAVHCRPEGEGYLVGVQLEQVLAGLAELAREVESYNQELREEVPHTADKRKR
jgi:PilZ domain